ncbi:DinB family protein [Pseudodonghicola flavimaris]|uniref:DinB family protein n=1 Tax=Pseudodonghicola flavimaris TaxID=3050036 RepID=A0ABT7F247_9RHOB|nr:DinB family protein [Pseudodonghicola flavimaris]MDK3018524.1 DinB family protein [Pseudodonghicola flavimaris]
MIQPAYCRAMARYNRWQNAQLEELLQPLPQAELRLDRGAFFGSILGTLSHLVWADQMWMSRFADSPRPAGGIADSPEVCASFGAWSAERFRVDGQILTWAEEVGHLDLLGELSWASGSTGEVMNRPMGLCVAHMFNHQTHHRGQIHAMMTAAGLRAPVSDLAFMPEP